jgi:MFS family permease
MSEPSFRSVLRNKNFLFLWASQIFSQIADRFLVALLLIVIHGLTNNLLAASVPLLSFGISAVLFGSVAGVFVDQIKKKYVLAYSNVIRAILLFLLMIFPQLSGSLVSLFVISFVIFTASQFFIPAESSSIPLIVEKKNLLVANSLFMSTWMSSTIVGFAVASILELMSVSTMMMFGITGVLYVFAALSVVFIKTKDTHLANMTMPRFRRDLILGFEFIRRSRIIRFALIQLFFASSVLAVLSELSLDYVVTILNIPQHYFGFFVSFAGLGMALGIMLLHKANKLSREQAITVGFLFTGVVLILLGLVSGVVKSFSLVFILGIGNAFVTIPSQTLLQEKTPKSVRGRVFGIQNMIVSSAFTIPVVLAGILAEFSSTRTVFVLVGALLMINTGINLFQKRVRVVASN